MRRARITTFMIEINVMRTSSRCPRILFQKIREELDGAEVGWCREGRIVCGRHGPTQQNKF